MGKAIQSRIKPQKRRQLVEGTKEAELCLWKSASTSLAGSKRPQQAASSSQKKKRGRSQAAEVDRVLSTSSVRLLGMKFGHMLSFKGCGRWKEGSRRGRRMSSQFQVTDCRAQPFPDALPFPAPHYAVFFLTATTREPCLANYEGHSHQRS